MLTHLERQGTQMINPTKKFSFRQQWHGTPGALDLNPITAHKHAHAKPGPKSIKCVCGVEEMRAHLPRSAMGIKSTNSPIRRPSVAAAKAPPPPRG